MTKYLISVYQPAGAERPAPAVLEGIMASVQAWRDELREAGSWVFSGGLHEPATATMLRPRDGEVLVTDGPFAEGKEYIGGLTIIDVPDLDAALEWGRRGALATTLPVEVRPFVDEPAR
ncbi:YciI family protein [Amycolatopsis acidiphila]|uniref:YCII-related domain-containing protein n=1 Tax=Amycolatopsis acidiphila TaxID=715473 RepID=A0A558AG94_9PSEU|nr:YciI family protein [Amycolatopsis acidiphila]TVT23289.1 hypothetical protein FNH06_10380 [Amycolatopsis acidiphila]UIJ56513.1 YciI family protein [Amycolatopsis acidiphila]GHG66875.1 hypothetical protein GCM10017788_25280 [Amycolatopsis acidiphila]